MQGGEPMTTPTQEDFKALKAELRGKIEALDKRLDELDQFKGSQEVRNMQLFSMIAEIKDDTRWIRRTFTSALIGGSCSAVIGLFVWLIQGGS